MSTKSLNNKSLLIGVITGLVVGGFVTAILFKIHGSKDGYASYDLKASTANAFPFIAPQIEDAINAWDEKCKSAWGGHLEVQDGRLVCSTR